MNKKAAFISMAFFFAVIQANAQKNSADSILIGNWKGTSICQIKNSPCHDEVVLYHISRAPGIDSFLVQADKIVNNKPEDMGTLHFRYNRNSKRFISNDYGIWIFILDGSSMDGTLMSRGALYRIIKLKKQL